MKNVQAPRKLNFKNSKKKNFVENAKNDLMKIKNSFIRIHDSGDFYSQAYLNNWIEIAGAFPKKTFYAYTKSIHLDFSRLPKNFKIVQSFGGLLDAEIDLKKPHAKVFNSDIELKAAGYLKSNETDFYAIEGKVKIGFVYHGTKKINV